MSLPTLRFTNHNKKLIQMSNEQARIYIEALEKHAENCKALERVRNRPRRMLAVNKVVKP